jgi:molybdopterin/thiamine biosynthesis adenylyltransferase
MRKVLIIGVGGIGSYLAQLLDQTNLYDLTIADPDVVEEKNLSYQNFTALGKHAVSKKKVDCLFLQGKITKIGFPILTNKQIEGYDLIICCADNLDVRKLIYRQGFQDDCNNKWLDLRAQGRNGALISYLTDPKFSETFLTGPEGSFSCQGEDFTETGKTETIHFTHVAIAGYGAQWTQRWFNGEEIKDKIIINI